MSSYLRSRRSTASFARKWKPSGRSTQPANALLILLSTSQGSLGMEQPARLLKSSRPSLMMSFHLQPFRDKFAFPSFSLPNAHFHRNRRLLSSRVAPALMTRQHCSVSDVARSPLSFACSSSFRPCTRPKMHPDCPTVSPQPRRTLSKLQLRTLQARLALLLCFQNFYWYVTRAAPTWF